MLALWTSLEWITRHSAIQKPEGYLRQAPRNSPRDVAAEKVHPFLLRVCSEGGEDCPKSEDQPQAKQIAHAPQQAVWSAVPCRSPAMSNGPLSDARRKIAGRSGGK